MIGLCSTPTKGMSYGIGEDITTTSGRYVNSPKHRTPSLRRGGKGFKLSPGNIKKSETPRKKSSNSVPTTIKVSCANQADRFIPNRYTSSAANSKISTDNTNTNNDGDNKDNKDDSGEATYPRPDKDTLAYQQSVASACGIALNTRILAFQPPAPQSTKPVDVRCQYNRPIRSINAQQRRKVSTAPERVLDAPGLVDDYYLNLLDWSSTNQVAIGLERSVYVWNAETGTVSCLLDTPESTYVSGLKWSQDGSFLSVGLGDGDVEIWDAVEATKLRTMSGHSARVGVLSWDKHIVSSGCRDGSIWNHDVRISNHKVGELKNHSSEVCGLEWRSDGSQLASGGNDNIVNIWDARSTIVPKFTKTNHKAAVKALAWCPWQLNLLATGGGSYDKYMHFWNSTTGARLESIDTGSQVTSIKWSINYKELVTSHGYPNNHLTIWSYPNLTRNVEINAHESRVLHSCLSPDGSTLATCASDENLKFWKLFQQVGKKTSNSGGIASKDMGKMMMIR